MSKLSKYHGYDTAVEEYVRFILSGGVVGKSCNLSASGYLSTTSETITYTANFDTKYTGAAVASPHVVMSRNVITNPDLGFYVMSKPLAYSTTTTWANAYYNDSAIPNTTQLSGVTLNDITFFPRDLSSGAKYGSSYRSFSDNYDRGYASCSFMDLFSTFLSAGATDFTGEFTAAQLITEPGSQDITRAGLAGFAQRSAGVYRSVPANLHLSSIQVGETEARYFQGNDVIRETMTGRFQREMTLLTGGPFGPDEFLDTDMFSNNGVSMCYAPNDLKEFITRPITIVGQFKANSQASGTPANGFFIIEVDWGHIRNDGALEVSTSYFQESYTDLAIAGFAFITIVPFTHVATPPCFDSDPPYPAFLLGVRARTQFAVATNQPAVNSELDFEILFHHFDIGATQPATFVLLEDYDGPMSLTRHVAYEVVPNADNIQDKVNDLSFPAPLAVRDAVLTTLHSLMSTNMGLVGSALDVSKYLDEIGVTGSVLNAMIATTVEGRCIPSHPKDAAIYLKSAGRYRQIPGSTRQEFVRSYPGLSSAGRFESSGWSKFGDVMKTIGKTALTVGKEVLPYALEAGSMLASGRYRAPSYASAPGAYLTDQDFLNEASGSEQYSSSSFSDDDEANKVAAEVSVPISASLASSSRALPSIGQLEESQNNNRFLHKTLKSGWREWGSSPKTTDETFRTQPGSVQENLRKIGLNTIEGRLRCSGAIEAYSTLMGGEEGDDEGEEDFPPLETIPPVPSTSKGKEPVAPLPITPIPAPTIVASNPSAETELTSLFPVAAELMGQTIPTTAVATKTFSLSKDIPIGEIEHLTPDSRYYINCLKRGYITNSMATGTLPASPGFINNPPKTVVSTAYGKGFSVPVANSCCMPIIGDDDTVHIVYITVSKMAIVDADKELGDSYNPAIEAHRPTATKAKILLRLFMDSKFAYSQPFQNSVKAVANKVLMEGITGDYYVHIGPGIVAKQGSIVGDSFCLPLYCALMGFPCGPIVTGALGAATGRVLKVGNIVAKIKALVEGSDKVAALRGDTSRHSVIICPEANAPEVASSAPELYAKWSAARNILDRGWGNLCSKEYGLYPATNLTEVKAFYGIGGGLLGYFEYSHRAIMSDIAQTAQYNRAFIATYTALMNIEEFVKMVKQDKDQDPANREKMLLLLKVIRGEAASLRTGKATVDKIPAEQLSKFDEEIQSMGALKKRVRANQLLVFSDKAAYLNKNGDIDRGSVISPHLKGMNKSDMQNYLMQHYEGKVHEFTTGLDKQRKPIVVPIFEPTLQQVVGAVGGKKGKLAQKRQIASTLASLAF